jgi:hypothetical protein
MGHHLQSLYMFWSSPSDRCYEQEWNGFQPLVVIFCMIYTAALPLFIVYKLYTHRRKLDDTKFRSKYGSLFRPYHRVSFFWEVISMLKKASFVVVTRMSSIQGYGMKFLYCTGIIGFFSALEVIVQPYASRSANLKSIS